MGRAGPAVPKGQQSPWVRQIDLFAYHVALMLHGELHYFLICASMLINKSFPLFHCTFVSKNFEVLRIVKIEVTDNSLHAKWPKK